MLRISRALVAAIALMGVVASACGGNPSSGTASPEGKATTVRLGYFPNLTHASAIIGVEEGIFASQLGPDRLETKLFNAGPDVVTAFFSGAIDAAYLGPIPAINAYAKSDGRAIRIVSGATSGGALLVVKPAINSVGDLRGTKLATPQLGGTQDIAARSWLAGQGMATNFQGGGDVSIIPQDNATTLDAFKAGRIDGAWVPEPWATRLVQQGGGKVLVDERSLWPGGQFVTTQLAVSTSFLRDHPDAVRRLVAGQVAANDFISASPERARKAVNEGITRYTGKGLPGPVIDAAWQNLSFTNDPLASSLQSSAQAAERLGVLRVKNLEGLYDMTALQEVLDRRAKAAS